MEILVAYGSSHGHTARIAERISARLDELGHDVVVSQSLDRVRVADFDAIIVGGRVHGSQYPWRVRRFIRKNLRSLRSRPTAFFSVSLLQLSRNPARCAKTRELPRRATEKLGWTPDRVAVFGGALQWKTQYGMLSPLAKLMWRRSLGPLLDPARSEQIFTDWDEVDRFANSFSSAVAGAPQRHGARRAVLHLR